MNPCPKCNSIPENSEARFCTECGTPLTDPVAPALQPSKDPDPDFVVSEAATPDPELVGTDVKPVAPADDDLGIETTTDQLQARASNPPAAHDGESGLIGDTMTPFAFESDSYEPPPPSDDMFGGVDQSPSEPKPEVVENNDPDAIPRLSSEELQAIERRMSQSEQNYLSHDEKRKLIEEMDKLDQPFSNTPIIPPKRKEQSTDSPSAASPAQTSDPAAFDDVRRSEAANRPPRYAYYYRNWVQLTGNPHLHDGDNLEVGEHAFVLKAKTLSTKLVLMIGGPIAAVVLFLVAMQFVGPTGSSDGSIAGLVVDEYSRPFIHGALVRVPDLGKNYQVNAQGMFVTDGLPSGTHYLEYVIDGSVIGSDEVTVSSGKVTTITLHPSEEVIDELAQADAPSQSSPPTASTPPPAESRPAASKAASSTSKKSTGQSSSRSSSTSTASTSTKSQSKSQYAKLSLKANVDGAKLTLDGSVLGAGNLTYSRLSPGKHKYSVSADGYATTTGSINLAADETNLLVIDLQPLDQASKQKAYGAEDFYYSGVTLIRDGELDDAITDLTEAIRIDPSYTDAYTARGGAYLQQRRFQLAHDDYLRAAEIHRMAKQFNYAITEYNNALKADDRSVAAHMGRASLFVAKGELLAAIADYESVIRVDRGNFDAYFGLGEARYKRGNYKAAIDHFKDARSLNSDNPLVYQYLMLCYLGDNDIKNVNKSYEKFVEVASPKDVDAMRTDSRYAAVLRVVEKE
ncbi:tetratricopeptide repeat protein [bacterium]|nr:tetratricopeptide repeat protein [bacterium]MCB2201694.1 tetratricopeptide repeat protein [bacterium]